MGDNSRISEKHVDINYQNTLDFFNGRGSNKALGHKYNYVLFQDENPELAVLRDKQEKEKISSLLNWQQGQTVLDLGCGIGRWGEEILSRGGVNYVGIDYSKNLLDLAEKNLSDYPNKKLLLASFQEFPEVLSKNNVQEKYDKIFINGVMMYLNDTDLEQGLKDVLQACGTHCELYLKESMGAEKRLTLSDFYSDSLTQNYTAIYRSIEEYDELINKYFLNNDFSMIAKGSLFDEKLKNRKETLDYYYVLKR